MEITKEYQKQQEARRMSNRISIFVDDFKVGTLLNKNGFVSRICG